MEMVADMPLAIVIQGFGFVIGGVLGTAYWCWEFKEAGPGPWFAALGVAELYLCSLTV